MQKLRVLIYGSDIDEKIFVEVARQSDGSRNLLQRYLNHKLYQACAAMGGHHVGPSLFLDRWRYERAVTRHATCPACCEISI